MHAKIAQLITGLIVTLTAVGIIAGAVLYFQWMGKRDAQVMDIEYCWTETGEHYLCN